MSARSALIRVPSARHRLLVRAGGALALTGAVLLSQTGPAGGDPTAAGRAPDASTPVMTAAASTSGAGAAVAYSTYLGGKRWDEGNDVEVDRAGNTYTTGFTLSADFPRSQSALPGFRGLADAFVTKHAPDGRVLWSTLLGGKDIDVGNSLAMDAAGNVYVTGRTASPDFPTTRSALQRRIRGGACQGQPCHDAFVTKLGPSGQLIYSTFLGGSANDEGVGIAVDRYARASVTGNTDSTDLPVRAAVQSRSPGQPCRGDLPCPYDVFVATLSGDGSRLSFGSYLGGRASDTAGGIAVDRAGALYVTGTTRSADFRVSVRAFQRAIRGRACGPPPGAPCLDAFVTKISGQTGSSRPRLVYSTFFGGSRNERSGGIAIDLSGRATVTGSTQSRDLPVLRALQPALDNASCTAELPEEQCDDAFVAQLDSAGGALGYSTYLGGKAQDQGLGVTVDRFRTVVVGRTDSRNFRVMHAVQPRFGGYTDGFVTELDARNGALVRSTFLGGKKFDRALGVDTGPTGTVHVTGSTVSMDFPTQHPAQPLKGGEDEDAFVTVLR